MGNKRSLRDLYLEDTVLEILKYPERMEGIMDDSWLGLTEDIIFILKSILPDDFSEKAVEIIDAEMTYAKHQELKEIQCERCLALDLLYTMSVEDIDDLNLDYARLHKERNDVIKDIQKLNMRIDGLTEDKQKLLVELSELKEDNIRLRKKGFASFALSKVAGIFKRKMTRS